MELLASFKSSFLFCVDFFQSLKGDHFGSPALFIFSMNLVSLSKFAIFMRFFYRIIWISHDSLTKSSSPPIFWGGRGGQKIGIFVIVAKFHVFDFLTECVFSTILKQNWHFYVSLDEIGTPPLPRNNIHWHSSHLLCYLLTNFQSPLPLLLLNF